MKISQIKISNILGVADLDFVAGKFNVITGANGGGKTSFLEAIKSTMKGGVDATLLRKGAERGEVVLLIDDGTTIKKRVTANNQPTTVIQNGVKVPHGSALAAMADMLSINPVEFLRVPKKQRLTALLDSLPINADLARLSKIVGRELKFSGDAHALELISALHTQVYDDRTGTNRAVKEKLATINQLSATLPDDDAGLPAGDLNGLLAQLVTIDGEKDAELGRIDAKLAGLRTASDANRQRFRDEGEEEIADLREQIEALNQKITERLAAAQSDVAAEVEAFAGIERLAGKQRETTLATHSERRSGIAGQVATLQQAQTQASKAAQTRETVAEMRTAAESLDADAAAQTATLAALEDYKSELMAVLPIDGLTVTDGEIYRHGVAFDRLNTQQQVEISVEIAKLRAGPLGFICVDGLECLDSAHFEAFRKTSLATDLQFFVSRVSDGPLEITAEF